MRLFIYLRTWSTQIQTFTGRKVWGVLLILPSPDSVPIGSQSASSCLGCGPWLGFAFRGSGLHLGSACALRRLVCVPLASSLRWHGMAFLSLPHSIALRLFLPNRPPWLKYWSRSSRALWHCTSYLPFLGFRNNSRTSEVVLRCKIIDMHKALRIKQEHSKNWYTSYYMITPDYHLPVAKCIPFKNANII